jgi:hypothetical protein
VRRAVVAFGLIASAVACDRQPARVSPSPGPSRSPVPTASGVSLLIDERFVVEADVTSARATQEGSGGVLVIEVDPLRLDRDLATCAKPLTTSFPVYYSEETMFRPKSVPKTDAFPSDLADARVRIIGDAERRKGASMCSLTATSIEVLSRGPFAPMPTDTR